MTDGFWSTRGSLESKIAAELKEGDSVLFYPAQTGKEGCFLGTATLASAFRKLGVEDAKKILHKEFLDCDTGVFITCIDRWAKPLLVSELRGKGAFGLRRVPFGQFFKGNFKRLKTRDEYETIMRAHGFQG